MKTGWRPKRLRKYQDRLDTHRTSRSRVATPDWSIDLKRRVRGKGSFTFWFFGGGRGLVWGSKEGGISSLRVGRTDDKTGEEGVDPAHDQRLRDHHRHVPLHHPHHPFHGRRVRHRVPGRLASVLGVFEEDAVFVGGDEIRFAGGE